MVYYNRAAWGASAPKSAPQGWAAGLPNSLTVHAVGAVVGEKPDYLATVKSIQEHAFGKGLSDIDYNYLVDYHGNIYEGRIPGARSGAQGVGNATSLAVCYLDNGDGDVPFTDAAKNAILSLRAQHVVGGAAAPIHPHRFWNNPNTAAGFGQYVTNCPGDEIAAWCANPTTAIPSEDDELTAEEKLRLQDIENKVAHIEQLIQDLHTGWGFFRDGWQNDGTATDAEMKKGVQKLRTNAYIAATR